MPSTIVITRDNLDNDDNNSFTYNYPSGMPFDNHEVAVESVSIPYAWANISSVLGNNQFTYSWVVGSTETAYTVTVEDGLYELSDINARLQFEMITNGHYLSSIYLTIASIPGLKPGPSNRLQEG